MNKHFEPKNAARPKPFDAPVPAEEMKRIPGVETKAKRTRAGKIFNLGRNLHQAVASFPLAQPAQTRINTGLFKKSKDN